MEQGLKFDIVLINSMNANDRNHQLKNANTFANRIANLIAQNAHTHFNECVRLCPINIHTACRILTPLPITIKTMTKCGMECDTNAHKNLQLLVVVVGSPFHSKLQHKSIKVSIEQIDCTIHA